MVSELSIRLTELGLLEGQDYEPFFGDQETKTLLASAAEQDARNAKHLGASGYSQPDPDNVSEHTETGFENVNAMLYLSTCLGLPHLNTRPASHFYHWKFADLMKRQAATVNTIEAFSEVLAISVPSLVLFPRTEALAIAEEKKNHLLAVTAASTTGEASRTAVANAYTEYLASWRRYDQSVRTRVLDTLAVLLEMRHDKRLLALRQFVAAFADGITLDATDARYSHEVQLRYKREVLEAQRALAEDMARFSAFDRCVSYLSFPVAAITSAGAVATGTTGDPLLVALGLGAAAARWTVDVTTGIRNRKFAWHIYLMHFKERLDRAAVMRELDRQISLLDRL